MAPKPRRRTIRFAIVAVVCLLLGAVTTVGVAWRTAMQWPWPDDVYQGEKSSSKPPWPAWAPADSTKAYRAHLWRFWPAFQRPWARSEQEWFGTHTDLKRYTCGWPLPALESRGRTVEDYHPASFDPGWSFVSWRTGLRLIAVIDRQVDSWGFPGGWATGRADRKLTGIVHFPLLPILPGFALDTAVYAAAWYLLLFTLPLIRAGRRRFRVSRGMCGSCGYDLKGSKGGPCPECGRAG